jgi:hypothetical protein
MIEQHTNSVVEDKSRIENGIAIDEDLERHAVATPDINFSESSSDIDESFFTRPRFPADDGELRAMSARVDTNLLRRESGVQKIDVVRRPTES